MSNPGKTYFFEAAGLKPGNLAQVNIYYPRTLSITAIDSKLVMEGPKRTANNCHRIKILRFVPLPDWEFLATRHTISFTPLPNFETPKPLRPLLSACQTAAALKAVAPCAAEAAASSAAPVPDGGTEDIGLGKGAGPGLRALNSRAEVLPKALVASTTEAEAAAGAVATAAATVAAAANGGDTGVVIDRLAAGRPLAPVGQQFVDSGSHVHRDCRVTQVDMYGSTAAAGPTESGPCPAPPLPPSPLHRFEEIEGLGAAGIQSRTNGASSGLMASSSLAHEAKAATSGAATEWGFFPPPTEPHVFDSHQLGPLPPAASVTSPPALPLPPPAGLMGGLYFHPYQPQPPSHFLTLLPPAASAATSQIPVQARVEPEEQVLMPVPFNPPTTTTAEVLLRLREALLSSAGANFVSAAPFPQQPTAVLPAAGGLVAGGVTCAALAGDTCVGGAADRGVGDDSHMSEEDERALPAECPQQYCPLQPWQRQPQLQPGQQQAHPHPHAHIESAPAAPAAPAAVAVSLGPAAPSAPEPSGEGPRRGQASQATTVKRRSAGGGAAPAAAGGCRHDAGGSTGAEGCGGNVADVAGDGGGTGGRRAQRRGEASEGPFKYIVQVGDKWRAQVGHQESGVQRKYYSGYVRSAAQAARDADRLLYKLRGPHFPLNFPLSESERRSLDALSLQVLGWCGGVTKRN
ncbi:hypothetical protein VOLCADRAFT_95484 [Volvox carteri f. nagariensis]|uniref:AP2/ERF domain-containing protein n=1 Tax=Volvox carteri f. nagariensis TaxID=3068 RepID=D8U7L0_VOLCA|nr:uncharacterized protein VOLCADRAFT_95484 [Volvox carteri f. nagariensis]EFJ44318.1 hypothetical protein VOLCADRAFT_95484 [Volvox carteri f. nagariensis]|eukprot:XP_002954677.1 hypothetical protein VOLCADRAFT_95484 [Volvox carteri f. nagariensis]